MRNGPWLPETKRSFYLQTVSNTSTRHVSMRFYYCIETKIGKLQIVETDKAVSHVVFRDDKFPSDATEQSSPLLRQASKQIEEYLDGKRRSFDLPLAPEGTEFQRAVWAALQTIPYGETRSYGDIARQIGRPKACRAVGMANNRNPISIVIPCHRVIGADGSLVGYGGGLDLKRKLLEMES